MFDSEVQRILDYIGRGIGVRVVGALGCGKTTVLRSVVAKLEKAGAIVHQIRGLSTHSNIPYAAIRGLGLETRPGRGGVLEITDVLAAKLATPGKHVLVADDIHFLDRESLAVLEAVRSRGLWPLLAAAPELVNFTAEQLAVLNKGREAILPLDPLHYEQVHRLIAQVLEGPADADTTARILTKSAGNPRLVVRIAETAALSKLFDLRDGLWHMAEGSVWNEHLRGTVESLLVGLSQEEITGLNAMAILGTGHVEILQKIVEPDVLDSLERRGLLAVMTDHHQGSVAAITPPVLADFFRGQKQLRERHVLRRRIAQILDATPKTGGNGEPTDDLTRVLSALRLEKGKDDAVNARHFQDHSSRRELTRFERWEANKSAANAASLLRIYWGAPLDLGRVQRIVTETSVADADPKDLLFLTINKALLSIYLGKGLAAAVEILDKLSWAVPELKDETDAAALFLTASHGRVPPSPASNELCPEPARTAFETLTQALLELYRCRPESALQITEGAEEDELFPHLRPFVRGFALFAAGRINESLVFSLDWRDEARRNVDQFGVVASSYVAVHGLLYSGHFDEAEYLMSSVFAMGRPGFVVDKLYDAMLRLSGLRHVATSPASALSIASQAKTEVPDIGPLPGVGKGAYVLIASSNSNPMGFDRRAAKLIKRQLRSGYVLEAALTALLCTCLSPGRPTLDLLKRIIGENGLAVHDQLIAVATAVVEGDHKLLELLVEHYQPDVDVYQVGMLLQAAMKRRVLEGDAVGAEAAAVACSSFARRFPTAYEPLSFSTFKTSPLTEREHEIAALAGYSTNMEISEKLGISARTVENHISNALRKTGATSRNSLFILVRNSMPAN
ncbi:LuxR C-terminal-related transcriptional regulator [Paenarthrobacter sp. NPDC090520]|uniref:LuxR C-terminal-related transcriptional regulator n=1 Tax=Paenarthrobacter sp. NPDC090520 TaxID=3364382 RepID=UPI00382C1878